MNDTCQPPEPLAIAVSGIAGSGKSTLGRALAASLRLPLVDLDAVTNPLLDALDDAVLGGHWLRGPHARTIREGRYAALRAVAADAVATAGGVVLVAPFTTELDGGEEWARLQAAVAPAALRMVYLEGDPQLLTARRAARGEPRDRHRTDAPPRTPAIPVVRIDAELSTPSSRRECSRISGSGRRWIPMPPSSPAASTPCSSTSTAPSSTPPPRSSAPGAASPRTTASPPTRCTRTTDSRRAR
ncbi:AAA family ATPase [Microbacterium sp. Se5.02b]|uniref:AAA family ATPase n=1 Tax=Microbacterium sp. Se5.02b TaxID=2864103 RepID=UPI001C68D8B4|nr:AAA family ATPase [Microbacterium sp. Se5.02b]QYM65039.1 AAA family ATPase [Microbacterium sp. Se5.02b]